jgi:hypothetical protein
VKLRILKRVGPMAAVATLALAGCATHKPQAPAQRLAEAPAPPDGVASEAMVFEGFMRRARAIDPGFSSASEVSEALQVAAAHEPNQLEAGMVAYAALAALQEPAFVAAVRRHGRDEALARRLATDPVAALRLPGGEAAAGRASAALLRQGEGLAASGRRVKQAAYTVQHQAWSKTRVADPRGRLARVKRLSAASYRPEPGDAAQLRTAVSQDARRGGSGAGPLVARGVALAALGLLGEENRGRALMSEARTGSCLRLAKLNLYQCLASAGPQYEDIYCLGQHAMIDPGQCVAEAARAPATRRAAYARAD